MGNLPWTPTCSYFLRVHHQWTFLTSSLSVFAIHLTCIHFSMAPVSFAHSSVNRCTHTYEHMQAHQHHVTINALLKSRFGRQTLRLKVHEANLAIRSKVKCHVMTVTIHQLKNNQSLLSLDAPALLCILFLSKFFQNLNFILAKL